MSTKRQLLYWGLMMAAILFGFVVGIGAAHGFEQWLHELRR